MIICYIIFYCQYLCHGTTAAAGNKCTALSFYSSHTKNKECRFMVLAQVSIKNLITYRLHLSKYPCEDFECYFMIHHWNGAQFCCHWIPCTSYILMFIVLRLVAICIEYIKYTICHSRCSLGSLLRNVSRQLQNCVGRMTASLQKTCPRLIISKCCDYTHQASTFSPY